MSSGENIEVSYFAALLAKALKQNDGDQFIQFYDLICKRATEDEVYEAKENARNLSNLPLQTLMHKIAWLEKLGVKPLRLSEQEKGLPKMTAVAPKKQNSTNQSDLSESLFEDSKASIDKKLPFGKSRQIGFSGETSLVELRNRMAIRDPAQTDFNFAYIDANEEDVVPDESPSLAATEECISSQEKNLLEEPDKQNNFKSSASRFESSHRNQECVIDMTAAEDQMENSWEYFSANASEAKLKVELLEMTDMTNAASNVHRSLKNSSLNHEDKADDAHGTRKKAKKGRKSKPKGLATDRKEDADNFSHEKQESNSRQSVDKNPRKATMSDRRKNSKLCKSISSETQPLLGSEQNKNRDYGTERPARKRTIKSFLQEEKNRSSNLASEPNGGSQVLNRVSRAEQLLEEEKRKEKMFPVEKMNEILRIVGDHSTVEVSTKNKKKSKEHKHTAPKKSKKKITKQKKVDKTKDAKVSEETTEPSMALDSVRVNEVQEDLSPLVAGSAVKEITLDGDANGFVTQKKRKGIQKQPTSGHVSPKTIASTKKRRFSDPSPTIRKNPAPAFFQDQLSSCHQVGNSQDQNNVSSRSQPLFNRESQSQWPTLPLRSCAASCKSVTGHNTASYASKLKSNLDSTGCSLASSSEDGSSTSSSSSNNCNAPSAGYINSATDRHISALSDLPLFTEEAAHTMKSVSPQDDSKEDQHDRSLPPITPSLTKVEPVRAVDRVVHGTNETFAKTGAIVKNTTKNNASSSGSLAATSDDQHEAKKSNCDLPYQPVRDDPSLPRDIKIDTKRSQNRFLCENDATSDVIFEFTSDCDDTHFSDIQVLSELENKWGLDFFTQDFSKSNFDNLLSPDVPVELSKSKKIKVLFGDNKLLNDIDSKNTVQNWKNVNLTRSSIDNVMFLLPSMRISSNKNKWNDPGHFQLRAAVNVLLQEWNAAVNEGKYYQE